MTPKLRALDLRPHEQDGQHYFLLRDPLQISDTMLLVPHALGPALMLCNGQWDLETIRGILGMQYGVQLEDGLLESLVEALDDAGFLENARFEAARAQALAEYRQAPFRPPALAGASYPADPAELRQALEAWLAEAGPVTPLPAEARGVLSPHIDYGRGGAVYAKVWKRAEAMIRAAEVVVLIGTDHYSDTPGSLTLTRQNYATPWGVLPTDTAIVDALAEAVGVEAAYAGELRHRAEHSLELVAVWVHHLRQGQPVALVPVLTGSFGEHIRNNASPAADPVVQRWLAALARATAGRRVVYVASGDLSHVGPAFSGDPLTPVGRALLKDADTAVIERLCAGDAEGFYRVIQEVEDINNVCGLSPAYLTLKALGQTEGECVAYQSCPADERDTSVVTVCGIVFE